VSDDKSEKPKVFDLSELRVEGLSKETLEALQKSTAGCPSSYKMGHQSGLSIGGSGSFA
jgi:hypothetical protein